MTRPALQRIVGRTRILRALSIGALARFEILLLSGHKDPRAVEALRRARRGSESLLTGNETFLLHSLAATQARLPGEMAEVGVYQGASARVICDAKGDRALHLFDTFSGLPEPAPDERAVLAREQFSAPLEDVRRLLARYPNVIFHPGEFPATAAPVEERRFSLVHLDVDLYASTVEGLEFFYPRLSPHGVIVVHDYSILPGVRAAVSEVAGREEAWCLELPTTQAIVMNPRPADA